MVKEKQKVAVNLIKDILKEKGIRVSKVIIFGSRVSGKALKDSDLDIVILSKDFEGKDIFEKVKMARGLHRKLVKQLLMPLDILYYSPLEWKNNISPIIEIAKKQGISYS
ncbi:MAG: nucleotidyltransferase domain-containing protein [Candidatus Omnitrophota bacterium]|nr:nucleotidyltransferase domain-containing protein [Candidatus Omnitrophota bacterium]